METKISKLSIKIIWKGGTWYYLLFGIKIELNQYNYLDWFVPISSINIEIYLIEQLGQKVPVVL